MEKQNNPTVLMMVPCEDILVHPVRQTIYSLINVMDRVQTDRFPFPMGGLSIYTRFGLFDGGEFTYRAEVASGTSTVVASENIKGTLKDKEHHVNAIITLRNFSLPAAGQLWVKVFVNDQEASRVPFFASIDTTGSPADREPKDAAKQPVRERKSERRNFPPGNQPFLYNKP
jgi:hypothetical protein